MDSIDVNTATPWQLCVLLDVSRDVVERLLAARPFTDVGKLRATLPESRARTVDSLRLRKLDINAADEATLIRTTGVMPTTAARIVQARPFHFMRQLTTLVDRDVYDGLASLFATRDLEFADKLTGQTIKLTPDPGRVLLSRSESESFSAVAHKLGLRRVFPEAPANPYEVLALPETEAANDVLSQLQESYGRNVLPAYRDQRSAQRYLNPRFCTVQFHADMPATLLEEIIGRLGLEIEQRHRTPGLYTLRIPNAATNPAELSNAIDALNGLPEVRFAEPNYLGFDDREAVESEQRAEAGSEASAIPWNLALARVPQAWRSTRGAETVIIVVIDSGVEDTHPALQGSLVEQGEADDWNFASDDDRQPVDDEGHGTFIAGLLVGNGLLGIDGICPACRVMPLKIPLTGDVDSYARRRDAILYALERVPAGMSMIMNLSWKTTGDIGLIRDAITTAVERGALVVASAGNSPERENAPHYPSDYPSVISVAAVGPTRRRAPYSYWGDEVDLCAPGGDPDHPSDEIRSLEPGGGTGVRSGTSFAAPHVAGIAALAVAARPSARASEVRFAIEGSAVPLAERGLGRGLVDAAAAIQSLAGVPAMSPSAATPERRAEADLLGMLNSGDAAALVAGLGVLPITARLIVARRPYTDVGQIRGFLGLSDDAFERLAMA